ncbi:nuclear transport factor 2 family protein [Nocardia sp. N2S4-5]|uniref:nuclear transport factor 2 family protein n=1 Tax=Nocardia sp. N2S4-5 TaxID=3351565 RepID=UPI0037D69592
MDRAAVDAWVERYEWAWRTPGTAQLGELFAPGASYLPSPWAAPITDATELARFWERARDGADEPFTMTSAVVALDGDTAVVRVEVEYARADPARWRDLWVLRFADDGRCTWFEEWPFAPEQADGH